MFHVHVLKALKIMHESNEEKNQFIADQYNQTGYSKQKMRNELLVKFGK